MQFAIEKYERLIELVRGTNSFTRVATMCKHNSARQKHAPWKAGFRVMACVRVTVSTLDFGV